MADNDYSYLDSVLYEYFKDRPDFSPSIKAKHAVKRTLDVLIGTAGLVIASPLIATMSLMTLYDSGRPAFFKQERIGYNGKHITIYKIRVMHNGTDEKVSNGKLTISDIYHGSHNHVYTKIGKILDRTHINELPQLWNVIKGEMSLVGNRPLPLYTYEKLIDVPGFIERYESKPGLVGYSQLRPKFEHGSQEIIDEEKRYSQIYSKGNVLAEDMGIMFKTIKMYCRLCVPKKYNDIAA